ncbi:hypothetical protein B0J12DRAFT_403413 [Macrophomina phaseolina]|uniref:DUF7730 domain-containing protein n=1 Tax=Macrophomina phaseolina TaxID=35725 RepID=A0ABQ8GJB0_9PEZI|nr:hypothetical protein B0J12DRAFT_403413 [Macrophomina phaseolina]
MHQRLACIRCFQDEDDDLPGWKHECWGWYYPDGTHRGPSPGHPADSSLLSLLQTCRLAYTEAIDILYTHNKFVVRQLKTLVDLERTTLPHRLHAIRYMHVDVPLDLPVDKPELTWPMYPPDPYHSMWVPACRVLSRMKGLQVLRVTVYDLNNQHRIYRQGNPDDMFVQLLEPLTDVKAAMFEVCLDAPIDTSYVLGSLGAAPFSLVIRQ